MTDPNPTPMQWAAQIVGEHLMPAAVRGLDALCDSIDQLADHEVRLALVFAVFFDRVQQREQPAAYTLDVPALDALSAAAERSVGEVVEIAHELPIESACAALGELIYLHREIAVTRAIACSTAPYN